ncbi:hypothetical protein FRC15_002646 [Serendipita sp. 397]|nr:hypothetical protein FRC15_002646 [Serendipita sp. 397]KAG8783264.1 hypothetical protein FRC16_002451 [Serendipita sp. 398]
MRWTTSQSGRENEIYGLDRVVPVDNSLVIVETSGSTSSPQSLSWNGENLEEKMMVTMKLSTKRSSSLQQGTKHARIRGERGGGGVIDRFRVRLMQEEVNGHNEVMYDSDA